MKLHEYLKQFEGLDPETEIYRNNPPAEGWESEHEYPQASNEGTNWWHFVYVDSLNTNVSYDYIYRDQAEPTDRFKYKVILV